ncbi:MAG: hypothetical protein IJA29_00270 [Lachnospiraceae bacterium]|nr:hypothetical protein [Lachnospiraceae bacterium]
MIPYRRKYDLNDKRKRFVRDWKVITRETGFEDMVNILRMFSLSDKDVSVKSRMNHNGQRVYSVAAYLSNEEYEMICQ